MDSYVAKEKKWMILLGLLAGGALLYAGVAVHFFHTSRWNVGPNHPIWIIFSVIGLICIAGACRSFIWPKTVLLADEKGITLFSGGTARVWNAKTRSFDVTRRKWEPKMIPWNAVREIAVGELVTGSVFRGPTIEALGGKVTVGQKRATTTKALKVLCDSSLKLEGFDIFGVSRAWNGFEESDLRQMSKSELARVAPDDLCSGFVFGHMQLSGGLQGAIKTLSVMFEKYRSLPPSP